MGQTEKSILRPNLRSSMFFELARAKNPVAERLIHTRDQKPFDIINCDTFFPPPEK